MMMKGYYSYSKAVLVGVSALYLVGCSTISNLVGDGDPIDYKSPKPEENKRGALQTPPDLRLMTTNDTYQHSNITATTYEKEVEARNGGKGKAQSTAVLPEYPNMRIARDGNNMRWLEIDGVSASVLMPKLRLFWESNGFNIETFSPELGLMETNWAENRANLPQDMLRSLLGSLFENLYSTGELDRYRTRIEPNGKGGVDVFVSHQGKEEVLVGLDKSQSKWVTRPSNPDLEAVFLRLIMQNLGAPKDQAQKAVEQPKVVSNNLIELTDGGSSLQIAEPIDRAWRRVRLGLDRGGFTVSDFNRSAWTFYMRFMGSPEDKENASFWSGWFGSSESDPVDLELRLKPIDSSRTKVEVWRAGAMINTSEAQKVLQLLQKQM